MVMLFGVGRMEQPMHKKIEPISVKESKHLLHKYSRLYKYSQALITLLIKAFTL